MIGTILITFALSLVNIGFALHQEFITPLPSNIQKAYGNVYENVTLVQLLHHNKTHKSNKYINKLFDDISDGKTFTATELLNFIIKRQNKLTEHAKQNNVSLAYFTPYSTNQIESASTQLISDITGEPLAEVSRKNFTEYMKELLNQPFNKYPQLCDSENGMQHLINTCKDMAKKSSIEALKYNYNKYGLLSTRTFRVKAIIKSCNTGWSAVGGWRFERCMLRYDQTVTGHPPSPDECLGVFECLMTKNELEKFSKKFDRVPTTYDGSKEDDLTGLGLAQRFLLAFYIGEYMDDAKEMHLGIKLGLIAGMPLLFLGIFFMFPVALFAGSLYWAGAGLAAFGAELAYPHGPRISAAEQEKLGNELII